MIRGASGGIGDRIPVGIAVGVAECGVHPLEHEIRDRVLEAVGLLVDLVPAQPQRFHEVGLDDPVASHDLDGDRPPYWYWRVSICSLLNRVDCVTAGYTLLVASWACHCAVPRRGIRRHDAPSICHGGCLGLFRCYASSEAP